MMLNKNQVVHSFKYYNSNIFCIENINNRVEHRFWKWYDKKYIGYSNVLI